MTARLAVQASSNLSTTRKGRWVFCLGSYSVCITTWTEGMKKFIVGIWKSLLSGTINGAMKYPFRHHHRSFHRVELTGEVWFQWLMVIFLFTEQHRWSRRIAQFVLSSSFPKSGINGGSIHPVDNGHLFAFIRTELDAVEIIIQSLGRNFQLWPRSRSRFPQQYSSSLVGIGIFTYLLGLHSTEIRWVSQYRLAKMATLGARDGGSFQTKASVQAEWWR